MKAALRAAFPASAAPCRCSLPGCRPDPPTVRRRLSAGSAPVSGLDGFCRGDATPPVRPTPCTPPPPSTTASTIAQVKQRTPCANKKRRPLVSKEPSPQSGKCYCVN